MDSTPLPDSSSTRILVVEDDDAIADAVVSRLRREQFEVCRVADGPSGVDQCVRFDPHLVVLDLMLPGLDGLEVCRRIQAAHRVPVLMLTARDNEADLLEGLAVGADDYLTKPFSPRELVARIAAILRRCEPAVAPETYVQIGSVTLDVRRRVVTRDGDTVHLTPLEFDLIVCLAQSRGEVWSRERLVQQVWGYSGDFGVRTVDSHVRSVRRKLGDEVIRTVHAVGYSIGTSP